MQVCFCWEDIGLRHLTEIGKTLAIMQLLKFILIFACKDDIFYIKASHKNWIKYYVFTFPKIPGNPRLSIPLFFAILFIWDLEYILYWDA